MKKSTILLFLLFFFVQFTKAQVKVVPNGNVGVGTTNPLSNLHVKKNIRIGVSNNPYLSLAPDTAACWWHIQNDRGLLKFGIGESLTDVKMTMVPSNGWVGIGTTNPSAPLQVETQSSCASINIKGPGDGSCAADIKLIDATDNKFWDIIRRDSSASTEKNHLIFSYWDGSQWKQTINFTPTQMVGIGTGAPSEKLDVNGNIYSSGYIKAQNGFRVTDTDTGITDSVKIYDYKTPAGQKWLIFKKGILVKIRS